MPRAEAHLSTALRVRKGRDVARVFRVAEKSFGWPRSPWGRRPSIVLWWRPALVPFLVGEGRGECHGIPPTAAAAMARRFDGALRIFRALRRALRRGRVSRCPHRRDLGRSRWSRLQHRSAELGRPAAGASLSRPDPRSRRAGHHAAAVRANTARRLSIERSLEPPGRVAPRFMSSCRPRRVRASSISSCSAWDRWSGGRTEESSFSAGDSTSWPP